jgi:hypothetical protein
MEPTSPTQAASQRFWQQYESEAQSLVTQGSQPDSRALPCVQIAWAQGGAPPVPEDELAALPDVLLLDAATATVAELTLPPVEDEPPVPPPMPPVDEEPPVGLPPVPEDELAAFPGAPPVEDEEALLALPPVPEDELDAFRVAPPVEDEALLALPPVPDDELAAFAAAWFEDSMSLPPELVEEQPARPDASRTISPRPTVQVARISVLLAER